MYPVKRLPVQYAGTALARAGRLFMELLAPPVCPVTGGRVESPVLLSAEGWRDIHFISAPLCACCGVPFSVDYGPGVLCASCLAGPPVFSRARAAAVYDNASYGPLLAFKHGDRTELARMFAGWLVRAGADMIRPDSLIVPVPLHRRRLRARRYNQSVLLARALAGRTGALMLPDMVRRVRDTPPQKDLSAEGRHRNVSGAFRINGRCRPSAAGRHVVLVDDVMTTGATLSAVARCLLDAGAATVDALVVARVVKGGTGTI